MEAATRPNLQVVGPDPTTIAKQMSKSELVVMDLSTGEQVADAADTIVGLGKLLEKAGRTIGALERQALDRDDPAHAGSEIIALIDHWRKVCGHEKAVIGKGRIKIVKARLSDGFALSSEEHLPEYVTLELAIDGMASHPYEVYGKRYREGKKGSLKTDLKDALGDEHKVEECARLGYRARKQGWTPSGGWPREENG